ncbi:Disintegrin [Oesophagostomum dentatum]|uniref:Disintegrin n=1 Tax=Oesophagostomum dentatum TaxID=61180 RepID=A0A0B1TMD9_OESDE|nr:Disintegrin [Oesophagostomum dentatum]
MLDMIGVESKEGADRKALLLQPKPRATVCRAAAGICDLPEYCNGDTPDCPADFFIQNGAICPGRSDEYCYEGVCGSRPDQCVSIWGPTAKEGDQACFQQNTNGIIQGNCGFDVHTAQFTRCLADARDKKCITFIVYDWKRSRYYTPSFHWSNAELHPLCNYGLAIRSVDQRRKVACIEQSRAVLGIVPVEYHVFVTSSDIMCGRLQCGTQAERPIFGDPTTVTSAYTYVRVGTETHQCHVIKTTYVVGEKNKPDPGMVLDGSNCGNDKICVNAKCKPLNEVLKTVSKCNDHCHYRGVCNNVGNCHCENGFGGIACEIPGFGGSVNSNTSSTSRGITPSTVFLSTLTIFSLALVLVCFYYWFRKKRNLVREWVFKRLSFFFVGSSCRFWEFVKKALNLRGVLVPVRKAPPPPRRHMKRESLDAMWSDNAVTTSMSQHPQSLMPPAIPLVTVYAENGTAKMRSSDQLLVCVPASSNGTVSKVRSFHNRFC